MTAYTLWDKAKLWHKINDQAEYFSPMRIDTPFKASAQVFLWFFGFASIPVALIGVMVFGIVHFSGEDAAPISIEGIAGTLFFLSLSIPFLYISVQILIDILIRQNKAEFNSDFTLCSILVIQPEHLFTYLSPLQIQLQKIRLDQIIDIKIEPHKIPFVKDSLYRLELLLDGNKKLKLKFRLDSMETAEILKEYILNPAAQKPVDTQELNLEDAYLGCEEKEVEKFTFWNRFIDIDDVKQNLWQATLLFFPTIFLLLVAYAALYENLTGISQFKGEGNIFGSILLFVSLPIFLYFFLKKVTFLIQDALTSKVVIQKDSIKTYKAGIPFLTSSKANINEIELIHSLELSNGRYTVVLTTQTGKSIKLPISFRDEIDAIAKATKIKEFIQKLAK